MSRAAAGSLLQRSREAEHGPAVAAVVLFGVCACVCRGGLLDGEPFGDVHYYATLASRMLAGAIPYRSLFLEYPPASIPAFLVPAGIAKAHYQTIFRLEMLACAGIAVLAGMACLEREHVAAKRLWLAGLMIGLLPLALGPVFLNTYDFWPTALMMVALWLLLAGRTSAAAGALGLATTAKVFPAALLPLFLRVGGRERARRILAWFAAILVLIVLPFAILGPGGLRFSFSLQSERGLEFETIGGSLLIALHHAHTELRPPGSREVVGSLATAVGAVSTLVQVVAVLLVLWIAVRGPRSVENVLLSASAVVAGLVVFGKVLSPQYLVWLVPLVPLVSAAGTVLLAAAAAMTQLWVLALFQPYEPGAASWAVVARNVLLVALYAVLVRTLMRGSRGHGEPAPVSTRRPEGAFSRRRL